MNCRILLPALLPAALALSLSLPCLAAPIIEVKAKRTRGQLIIDASMTVPVNQQLAYEVLTDYAHMPAFIPNIKESRIVERHDNKLIVNQKGRTSSGVFSISWETTRDVTLTAPNEIHSRIIGGTIKQGESTTRLTHDGHVTKIVVHSQSTASALMPPVIGVSMVESQVKKQYGELRAEMLKRQKLAEHKAEPPAASAPH